MREALAAYGIDASYAVSMAHTAAAIIHKRATWALRIELRAAEKVARTACVASDLTSCDLIEPCGTSACPYARGDLAELVDVPSFSRLGTSKSKATRPQPGPDGSHGLYSIEAAVQPLMDLRSS